MDSEDSQTKNPNNKLETAIQLIKEARIILEEQNKEKDRQLNELKLEKKELEKKLRQRDAIIKQLQV